MKFLNEIICGHVVDVLKKLPDRVVNCIVTSPPYWGLRAYKTEPQVWGGDKNCEHKWGSELPRGRSNWDTFEQYRTDGGKGKRKIGEWNTTSGQFCALCSAWRGELGLEPTIELYIEHFMMVFDGLKRVLRDDGICFVNLGDTYGGTKTGNTEINKNPKLVNADFVKTGGQAKSLCNIPEKFSIAMEKAGWIKRCNIIWAKGLSFCPTYSGSCMPDSAKDRPNKNGFEWVYMFTKKKHYWYEQQYEPAQELNAERPRMGQGNQTIYNQKRGNAPGYDGRKDTVYKGGPKDMPIGAHERWPNPLGRTIRNVWTINPEAFSEAHFATFPSKLVEILLKMGCPEFVCKKCGLPRSKVYEANKGGTIGKGSWLTNRDGLSQGMNVCKTLRDDKSIERGKIIGLTDCGCNAGWKPGIILDPFGGSCTTALVAYQQRRDFIMIELQPDYVRMGQNRLKKEKEKYGLLESNS